jgi:hypothetical protein
VGSFILRSGLPDAVFSNPKSQSGYIFEGPVMDPVMDDVGILYGNLVYICGLFYSHIVYFVTNW